MVYVKGNSMRVHSDTYISLVFVLLLLSVGVRMLPLLLDCFAFWIDGLEYALAYCLCVDTRLY